MAESDSFKGSSRETALWYGRAMEHLVEVVLELSHARDLATIMAIVKRAARSLTGADGATFVLRDGDQCHYADEDAISPLWKGLRFPMSACISGWSMLNRQSAVIEDIYADPRIPADAYRPTFVKSLVMVPIRRADPVGAIGSYWAQHCRPGPERVKLLQALADTTAVALDNVRLYAELEKRVGERTSELETILANIQAGVLFVVEGQIVRANPKAAELLGIDSASVLVGMPIGLSLRSAAGDISLLEADSGTALVKALDAELQLESRHGTSFWAHVIRQPLDPLIYPGGAIWLIEN
ncbi:MAG: GAF domain-containing protein, partial [Betaproteobacteria bacterium]|nr:GAF domain-containing protein [Betaproteobacteria bacterium]